MHRHREHFIARVALALGALSSASCRTSPTQVEIFVDTNVSSARRATLALRILHGSPSAADVLAQSAFDQTFESDGGLRFPTSFSVVPRAGEPRSGPVTVLAVLSVAEGEGQPALRVERLHRFQLRQATAQQGRLYLQATCGTRAEGCTTATAEQCTIARRCIERGETCGDEGTCVGLELPLTAVSPSQPLDAAVIDTTPPAARDAATPDALDATAPIDVMIRSTTSREAGVEPATTAPCVATGRVINVGAGQSIAAALASAVPGDTVALAAGAYVERSLQLPLGVSLRGSGRDSTTIRFTGGLEWWRARLELVSETESVGAQCVSDLALEGTADDFAGIHLQNRSQIRVDRVRVRGFYYYGVRVTGAVPLVARDIELSNFELLETSVEGGSSQGALTVAGNVERLRVHHGTITHQSMGEVAPDAGLGERSGVGIKFIPYFAGSEERVGLVRDAYIGSVRFGCKPTTAVEDAGVIANRNLEVWRANVEDVELAFNRFACSVALESAGSSARSYWVHDNVFAPNYDEALSISAPNALVEGNSFDVRGAPRAQAIIVGARESGAIVGGRFISNVFVSDNAALSLFGYRSPIEQWRFEDNVLNGRAAALVRFRGANSNGSNGVTVTHNSFGLPGLSAPFVFAEGSDGQPPRALSWTDNVP